jgi:hypothetical protein
VTLAIIMAIATGLAKSLNILNIKFIIKDVGYPTD